MAQQNHKDKEERVSLERRRFREGLLGACFTQKGWFCKIYPAYPIDKIKFSFVMKGQNGTGFDVYVDVPKFDLLCDDILSFRLYQKIEADRAANKPYPEAWVHNTGENASKSVKIGHGKSGVLIQGGTTQPQKQFGNVPCTYDDLRIIAKWFKRTSEKWFNEAAEEIVKSSERYRNSLSDDDLAESVTVSSEAPARNEPEKPNVQVNTTPARQETKPVIQQVKPTTAPVRNIAAKPVGENKIIKNLSFAGGEGLVGNALNETGERIYFSFDQGAQALIQTKMSLQSFKQAYTGKSIHVVAKINGDFYKIVGLATA